MERKRERERERVEEMNSEAAPGPAVPFLLFGGLITPLLNVDLISNAELPASPLGAAVARGVARMRNKELTAGRRRFLPDRFWTEWLRRKPRRRAPGAPRSCVIVCCFCHGEEVVLFLSFFFSRISP